MKKILFNGIVFCLLGAPAFAQMNARVFDNFDTSRGVRIVTPTVIAAPVEAANKRATKKSAQKPMDVSEAVSRKNLVQPIGFQRLSMMSGKTMNGFTTGDAAIDSYIVDSAVRYGIDPLLIYSQMHQESSFKLKAMSYKGARGLMQLMPATAIRLGVKDIYNPRQNIEGGVKYMRWLLDMFGGDVALALAGYNAGEGAVLKYGRQIPPYRETQEYVRRISARYNTITNPNVAKIVRKVSNEQAVELENKQSAPLTALEQDALTIRLADGRMILVNQ